MLYQHAGVHFDIAPVAKSWQILPSHLLRDELLRSLWYLHSQPPLMNLVVGVAMHSPWDLSTTLHGVFLTMGVALTVVLYFLALELRVPRSVATVGVGLLIASPSLVLYENWVFSTYPTLLFLALSTLYFARSARRPNAVNMSVFGLSLAGLTLTRSTYHVAGAFVVVFVLFRLVGRVRKRAFVVAVVLPVVVVAGLQVKNLVLFGQPAMSSWAGMNLAHMVLSNNAVDVRHEVDEGKLSRYATISPFGTLAVYGVPPSRTGVAALDIPNKGNDPNLNNFAYLKISKQYFKDSLHYIERHPGRYLQLVDASFRTMFTSPADYSWIDVNHRAIFDLAQLEHKVLGQRQETYPIAELDPARYAPQSENVEWVVALAYLGVIACGVILVIGALKRRSLHMSSARLAVAYVAITVAYGVFASNMFELGENMRFRFETDPVVAIASLAVLCAIARRFRQVRRKRIVGVS